MIQLSKGQYAPIEHEVDAYDRLIIANTAQDIDYYYQIIQINPVYLSGINVDDTVPQVEIERVLLRHTYKAIKQRLSVFRDLLGIIWKRSSSQYSRKSA